MMTCRAGRTGRDARIIFRPWTGSLHSPPG